MWWASILVALGLVLLWRGRRRRLGLLMSLMGLGCLWLMSLPAVSNRLWHSLEADAPFTIDEHTRYDVVILLGGAVSAYGSTPEEPAWNDNVERLLEVRSLLADGRAERVLVTGGSLGSGLPTEAEYLSRELQRLGIAQERIMVEAKANNTRENAVFTKSLVEPLGAKKLLLVTSAFHMPRAMGCFEAVGLHPDAFPVDYRLRALERDPHLMPRGDYLSQSTRALHEWLGRAVYWVLGYSRA